MSGLKSVSFADGCELTLIEDHVFRDCALLEEIALPDDVEHVGISAFRGCDGLRRLSIPAGVADEPGIREIAEILPACEVVVRGKTIFPSVTAGG